MNNRLDIIHVIMQPGARLAEYKFLFGNGLAPARPMLFKYPNFEAQYARGLGGVEVVLSQEL